MQALFFDPQTSGGLLVSIAPAEADAVRDAMQNAGVPVWTIGQVAPTGASTGSHVPYALLVR
jgi:selenide,water dikinase